MKLPFDLLRYDEVGRWPSIGLLVLRAGAGLSMALGHGLGKFQKLVAGGPIKFADPFHIGPTASITLAVVGELVCGLLLALGLGTRLATLPFGFTMVVALVHVHRADPFGTMEKAVLYLVVALTLFFTGPGRFSLDHVLSRRR